MIVRRIAALTFAVVAVGAYVGRAAAHSEQPPSSIRITRDIVYRSLPGWRGTLDIYRRRNARSAQPTVVYIHGGGIPKEGDADAVLPYLKWGFQVVRVEYHWDQAGPIAIEDCRCALRWISAHREAYQIDARNLIVTGNSAGGHLALMVGMLPPNSEFDRACPSDEPLGVAAIINLFGMTDLGAFEQDATAGGRPWVRRWLARDATIGAVRTSPIHYVRAQLPPILTIHGDADRLVPFTQAVTLDEALRRAGADHTLVRIPGGSHGAYWPWPGAGNDREAAAITEFLIKHRLMSDRDQRVLIYLHGRIVEEGIRPKSDRYGYYEYQSILDTFKKAGFHVISERRHRGTDIEQYAHKVADEVEGLRQSGVAPARITLVGASQGAWIAMLVSTLVKSPDVNYVIMAGCGADPAFGKLVNLHGNVLSIYESSDAAGTCESYFHDATGLRDHEEVALHTGLAHGFIYRPLREWVEPATRWAESAHPGR